MYFKMDNLNSSRDPLLGIGRYTARHANTPSDAESRPKVQVLDAVI